MTLIMNECWYAFALALISHKYMTPEAAFWYLARGKQPRKGEHEETLAESDVRDMVFMRDEQAMTWREIANCYGLSNDAARRRILRYKNKKGVAI